jgi:hypothetical protein
MCNKKNVCFWPAIAVAGTGKPAGSAPLSLMKYDSAAIADRYIAAECDCKNTLAKCPYNAPLLGWRGLAISNIPAFVDLRGKFCNG